jgi:hypothetical protein
MPIKVEDAKRFRGYEELEIRITKFLESHREYAYTSDEIREALGLKIKPPSNELTLQNIGLAVLDAFFAAYFEVFVLDRMVKEGKIKVSEVGGKKYYYVE